MASLLENISDLRSIVDRIKSAIVSKGVTPTGALDTYADAIELIEGGGGTDVSDTTATEDDVVSPKKFHKADGSLAEGNITNKGQVMETVAMFDAKTLVSGYYDGVNIEGSDNVLLNSEANKMYYKFLDHLSEEEMPREDMVEIPDLKCSKEVVTVFLLFNSNTTIYNLPDEMEIYNFGSYLQTIILCANYGQGDPVDQALYSGVYVLTPDEMASNTIKNKNKIIINYNSWYASGGLLSVELYIVRGACDHVKNIVEFNSMLEKSDYLTIDEYIGRRTEGNATQNDIPEGKFAWVNGVKIDGNVVDKCESQSIGRLKYITKSDTYFYYNFPNVERRYLGDKSSRGGILRSDLGDATPELVAKGTTFSSSEGIMLEGEMDPSGGTFVCNTSNLLKSNYFTLDKGKSSILIEWPGEAKVIILRQTRTSLSIDTIGAMIITFDDDGTPTIMAMTGKVTSPTEYAESSLLPVLTNRNMQIKNNSGSYTYAYSYAVYGIEDEMDSQEV